MSGIDFDFMYYQMETVDLIRKLDYKNPQDKAFMRKLYNLLTKYSTMKRRNKRRDTKWLKVINWP